MILLIKDDCLEVMKEIRDASIDAIICDPPYGTTQCKWDSVINLDLMWNQLKRIIKPKGVIILFCSQPFTSILTCSNLKMFRYSLVWKKSQSTGHLNAWRMPLRAHEDILVFYKKLPNYNHLNNAQGNLHPTQKPDLLLQYLIKTYTNENDTVLDFAMGSGTTGVAAKNLNRNFVGIELDENYFNIAKDRIKNTKT